MDPDFQLSFEMGQKLFPCRISLPARHAAPTTTSPAIRVTEVEIDQQVLSFFDKMRIVIEEVCEWVRTVLRSQTKETQVESLAERAVIQRHLRLAVTE